MSLLHPQHRPTSPSGNLNSMPYASYVLVAARSSPSYPVQHVENGNSPFMFCAHKSSDMPQGIPATPPGLPANPPGIRVTHPATLSTTPPGLSTAHLGCSAKPVGYPICPPVASRGVLLYPLPGHQTIVDFSSMQPPGQMSRGPYDVANRNSPFMICALNSVDMPQGIPATPPGLPSNPQAGFPVIHPAVSTTPLATPPGLSTTLLGCSAKPPGYSIHPPVASSGVPFHPSPRHHANVEFSSTQTPGQMGGGLYNYNLPKAFYQGHVYPLPWMAGTPPQSMHPPHPQRDPSFLHCPSSQEPSYFSMTTCLPNIPPIIPALISDCPHTASLTTPSFHSINTASLPPPTCSGPRPLDCSRQQIVASWLPPTPASGKLTFSNQLNSHSLVMNFLPRSHATVTIKTPDGLEVHIEDLKKGLSSSRQPSPSDVTFLPTPSSFAFKSPATKAVPIVSPHSQKKCEDGQGKEYPFQAVALEIVRKVKDEAEKAEESKPNPQRKERPEAELEARSEVECKGQMEVVQTQRSKSEREKEKKGIAGEECLREEDELNLQSEKQRKEEGGKFRYDREKPQDFPSLNPRKRHLPAQAPFLKTDPPDPRSGTPP
ncbi:hypothetical protein F5878DRAFT_667640, partial [Lentinula raphanica]